jgi:hypothetical protein
VKSSFVDIIRKKQGLRVDLSLDEFRTMLREVGTSTPPASSSQKSRATRCVPGRQSWGGP